MLEKSKLMGLCYIQHKFGVYCGVYMCLLSRKQGETFLLIPGKATALGESHWVYLEVCYLMLSALHCPETELASSISTSSSLYPPTTGLPTTGSPSPRTPATLLPTSPQVSHACQAWLMWTYFSLSAWRKILPPWTDACSCTNPAKSYNGANMLFDTIVTLLGQHN